MPLTLQDWNLIQPGFCFAVLVGLAFLETRRPLVRSNGRVDRILFHGGLFFFNSTLFTVFIAGVQLSWIEFIQSSRLGLGALLQLPQPLEIVFGILLLDLAGYGIHRLHHRIPFLWNFHRVHHSDTQMDVTTGFRSHFGQSISSALFQGVALLLIGPSPIAFIFYASLLFAATHFHHSNIKLSPLMEQTLSPIFVTPKIHLSHHLRATAFHHSTFSGIFSFWDRLFSTSAPRTSLSKREVGLSSEQPLTLQSVFFSPFETLKPRWAFVPFFLMTLDALAGSCSSEYVFEPTFAEKVLGLRWPLLVVALSLGVMIFVARKRRTP